MTASQPHPLASLLGFKSVYDTEIALRTTFQLTRGETKFLLQVGYWSDKTKQPEGWIHKSYEEWSAEIGYCERSIRGAVRKLEGLGLDSEVHKSALYKGKPVLHCRLDMTKFTAACVQVGLLDKNGRPPSDREKVRRKVAKRRKEKPAPSDRPGASGGTGKAKQRPTKADVMDASATLAVISTEALDGAPTTGILSPSPSTQPAEKFTAGPGTRDSASDAADGTKHRAGTVSAEALWEALRQLPRFQAELESLDRFGYDDDLNPPNTRRPKAGEPEQIVRHKYGQRRFQEHFQCWLEHGAMDVPVMDIQVATQLAPKQSPEFVERIVSGIRYQRQTIRAKAIPEHWKDLPDPYFRNPRVAKSKKEKPPGEREGEDI